MKIDPAPFGPDRIKWFDNQRFPDVTSRDPPLPEKGLSDMPTGE